MVNLQRKHARKTPRVRVALVAPKPDPMGRVPVKTREDSPIENTEINLFFQAW